MHIQDAHYITKIVGDGSVISCLNWIKDTEVKQDTVVKITAGGDKNMFLKWHLEQSIVLFDGVKNSSKLSEATFYSSKFIVSNGVKVGDSLDQVMSTFLVYDGPSHTEIISVVGDIYKIVYTFESEILKNIRIEYK